MALLETKLKIQKLHGYNVNHIWWKYNILDTVSK